MRHFSLPEGLQAKIDSVLQTQYGLRLSNSKELASAVQKMSNYYLENPDDATPWSERWAQIAQLAYYFPLNFLRASAVVRESKRFDFLQDVNSFADFGAGLGPIQAALQAEGFESLSASVLERSFEAKKISRSLGLNFDEIGSMAPAADRLLTFSYSLTELVEFPEWILKFPKILIIEPSTRQDGRRLLEFRKKLQQAGMHLWAPCTHQDACPLLEKSPADWCHDRLHFDRPDWWLKMEKHLPFLNPTVTFSYLLVSRTLSPASVGKIRLVGDFMKEKGKSRQMICRGPEREFFGWLHRGGEIPEFPRGIVVNAPAESKIAGNELRPLSSVIVDPFDLTNS